MKRTQYYLNKEVHLISLGKTSGYSISIIFKIYKLLKKLKPDIIHTHLRSLTYASIPIGLLKIPTIHTIHNLAEKETKPIFQKVHKILFNFFNIVPVSISDLVLNSVQVRYGLKYDELIYNGVKALSKSKKYESVQQEINSYKRNQDTLVFLAVGRISKQKNQLMLIEVIKALNSDNVNIALVIIGSLDSEVDYSKDCLTKAKNIDNIHFIGIKSNIGDYMLCSDALCLSSIYEGLPLVVLEAFSMGKVVLSTPAGGVPDVIEQGINGYTSNDFEKDSFYRLLVNYQNNPINNTKAIKELYVDNYSIEICASQYYNLYCKASGIFL